MSNKHKNRKDHTHYGRKAKPRNEAPAEPTDTGIDRGFLRARISGRLICESDLHVGDGGELPWRERRDLPQGREPPDTETNPSYHGVCWSEKRELPYIPAATLRGSLRAQLPKEGSVEEFLFGYAKLQKDGGARSGAVRFQDALLDPDSVSKGEPPPYGSATRKTAIHHGIERDPITGAVKHGRLFSHEVVPAGSRFRVELTLERCTDECLSQLLALLQRWDGNLCSALGGKRGKGWGRVRWELEKESPVMVLTENGLNRWLKDQSDKSVEKFFSPWTRVDKATLPERPTGVLELAFKLIFDGPVLVAEPGYREKKGEEGNDHPPDHEYSRRASDQRPIIPGRSLVGMLRGRARRIVASIAHLHYSAAPGRANTLAETLVGELFGDTHRRGALWIGDAEANSEVQPHAQFFNAIDRFTGGVKDGALYQANASIDGAFIGQGLLELERMESEKDPQTANGWKGLLLFLARDALEGELSVGWGKAKGYGSCRVELTLGERGIIRDWGELLALEEAKGAEGWVEALHNRIAAEVENAAKQTANEGETPT